MNRHIFEDRLLANIRTVLPELPPDNIFKIWGRILVHSGSLPVEEVIRRLQKVFGIVSLSPCLVAAKELPAIQEAALAVLEAELSRRAAQEPEGKTFTFKVEPRRADKSFPLTSPELAPALGGYLLPRLTPRFSLQVDVHNPEIELNVEVRPEGVYLAAAKIPGPGGLPVGSNGRVLLLLSGGIDSPVAGWMALKRGVELAAVHFHSFPFTSERAKEKVIDLCRILAGYAAGTIHLYVVPFTQIQTALRKQCPEDWQITLMRRMMFRIAARLARRLKALALVTGESLGQVASQTLESMQVINAVVQLPVLRPLVGMDKAEIIERAQAIGTYTTSILPYEDCCTVFVPRHPKTKPQLPQAEALEASLPIEELVAQAVVGVEHLVINP